MERDTEGKCLTNSYSLAKSLLIPNDQHFVQFDKDYTKIHNNLCKIIQMIMDPIIYFIEGRSPTRHKWRFCI